MLCHGKAEWGQPPGSCGMHIGASVQQQSHHVWPIVLYGKVQRLLMLVHDSQRLVEHGTISLDQRPNAIWLAPSDCREDIEPCAPGEQEIRNLAPRSFA